MTICDAVVFPYLEIGLSSSGRSRKRWNSTAGSSRRGHTRFLNSPSITRTRVEFFDIGNHLELAERLQARPQFGARRSLPEFNVETNKATYLLANSIYLAVAVRFGRRQATSMLTSDIPSGG